MKKTSLLALAAAAGLFATGASAADLGGNCCADLEERIAELEATTARKGNRKVKLTVSGQVNEAVMWFDDGKERNIYIGTNMIAQTRFRFVGDAKITGDITAGYLLEIGTESASLSNNNAGNDDVQTQLAIRHSAWWIQHKDMGKIWLGQTSQATDGITEVDLSNRGHFASPNSGAYMGGFIPVVSTTNAYSTLKFYNFLGGFERNGAQIGEGYRFNVIKYDSPTIMGFMLSSSFGEDDMWDVALRYAGEHHGFKLAGAIGYSEWTDGNAGTDQRDCLNRNTAGVTQDAKCSNFGLSGSVMHVQTGLFVTGAYGRKHDDLAIGATEDKNSTMWYISGGIEQNWLGIGKTTAFGEYEEWRAGTTPTAATLNVAKAFDHATMNMWGLGLNQSIDAAAMDIYLHYRNYNDITSTTAGAVTTYKDFQTFMAGALIKF